MTRIAFRIVVSLSSCLLLTCGLTAQTSPDQADSITFFVTSDSHYTVTREPERNDRNKATIERMNALPGVAWPEKLGGGPIGKPRGVLVLGDLVDLGDKPDETPGQWRQFEKQFGSDGADGLLKYPVFEGFGNHDGPPIGKEKFGFSTQAQIKVRNEARTKAGRISRVSENGLHYSWDWGQVHFIQANLYPADVQHPKVRYALPWHNPQNALAFMKEDLKATVADSGRPVVIMSHCGVDTDWWHPDDWAAFYTAVKPYNVIAYFYGHTGTGLRKWKPNGEDKLLDCINTGQTEKGFFVVEITPKRMRLGYHIKTDPKVTDNPMWGWKFLLDKPLEPQKERSRP